MTRAADRTFAGTSWTALAVLIGLTCALPAASAEESGQPPASPAPWMDRLRGEVREATSTLAGSLDAFLSDREYEAGLNETRLALRFGTDLRSDGDASAILKPRIRLSLPHTERKLFLDVFGAPQARQDDVPASGGLLSSDARGGIDAVQLRLGTTIRGIDVAPAIGLRFDDGTPSAYVGVRVGASRDLDSGLTLSGSQRLVLDSDRLLEAVSLLRADWPVDERSLLRGQVVVGWRRDRDGLRREPALVYRRFLDDRTAISLETTLTLYTAAADETDSLETGLRVRRQLHEEWLFAELRPWASVEPRDMTDPTYGLELSMDVAF